mmetsp:Transcript_12404/g.37850  ORF Transcript_12404/g.37850 Transcript_12404/m.37850 type:complete len:89 (-) Transcript_12404:731-997(-)
MHDSVRGEGLGAVENFLADVALVSLVTLMYNANMSIHHRLSAKGSLAEVTFERPLLFMHGEYVCFEVTPRFERDVANLTWKRPLAFVY